MSGNDLFDVSTGNWFNHVPDTLGLTPGKGNSCRIKVKNKSIQTCKTVKIITTPSRESGSGHPLL